MSWRQLLVGRVLPIGCILVGLSSCAPDVQPVSDNAVHRVKPSSGSKLLTPLSASITSETNESHDTIAMGTFAEPTIATVTATGSLFETFGSPWANPGDPTGSGNSDASGTWDAGFGICEHCLSWFTVGSGSMGGVDFSDGNNANFTTSAISVTQVVKGAGFLVFHGGPYVSSGSWCHPDCYHYDGNITVQVTPLTADLELHVAPLELLVGQSVTATANPNPRQLAGIDVPFRVTSWHYQPTGGSNGAVCATDTLCVISPTSSGTLTVEAYVNGDLKTQHQAIVVRCKTNDTLLDDLSIRKNLRDAWNAANTGASPSGRKEIGGGRFPNGGAQFDTTFVAGLPGATPCRLYDETVWNFGSGPPSGWGLPILTWHVHPFWPKDWIPLTNCPERNRTDSIPMAGNPSPGDYTAMNATPPVPFIVVDGANIYVVRWISFGTPKVYPVVGGFEPFKRYKRSTCDPAS